MCVGMVVTMKNARERYFRTILGYSLYEDFYIACMNGHLRRFRSRLG